MLTEERKNILIGILEEDTQRAKELMELEPEEALAEINKIGYDFTLEDLQEFGEMMKQSSEMDFEALDEVAGGGIITLVPMPKLNIVCTFKPTPFPLSW